MKLVIDSSSIAKKYVQEEGSDKLDHFLANASELAFCVIMVPEIVSGLNRRLRERVLTAAEYGAIKKQLLVDVRDAIVLQITPAVIFRTVNILENNVLRALDAVHVACAIEWQADLFLTSDKRQFIAAKKSKLHVEYIG